ncbi:MAG: alpha/beta hydrolase [Acidobacteriota bacterium]|nr:alpha/beta hydrolase [Acidobacteriota bacterium]
MRRLLTLTALLSLAAPPTQAADCVILLHGLARTSSSMAKAAEAFEKRGFSVANIDYPSRERPVEELAPVAVEAGLAECPPESVVHFMTHSLGGILVRYYLEHEGLSRLGRVVMLAPPNQGSEVVDSFRDVPGFRALNGPAGLQLGTDESSVPLKLGPVEYELGVIAGDKTFNPILSQSLPNPDDGKVSVESTKVEGMSDFIVVPHSHPFIMGSSSVIEQAVAFIETGGFEHDVP